MTIITLIPNKTKETVKHRFVVVTTPCKQSPSLEITTLKVAEQLNIALTIIDSSRQQDSGGCNALLSPDHVNNHPRGQQDDKTGDLQR